MLLLLCVFAHNANALNCGTTIAANYDPGNCGGATSGYCYGLYVPNRTFFCKTTTQDVACSTITTPVGNFKVYIYEGNCNASGVCIFYNTKTEYWDFDWMAYNTCSST